jgi:hypothetical protein
LPVGVDYPRDFAGALGLNRKMGRKHGFSAAAFLRFDDYCFHEKSLSIKQAFHENYTKGREGASTVCYS